MQLFSFPLFLARLSSRAPWLVLFFASVLTIFSIFGALKLELRNDFLSLLPKELPSSKMLRRVIEANDGLGYQAVIVNSPDAAKNEAFLMAVRDRLHHLYSEPPVDIADALDDQYHRMHGILRDTFHQARHPDPYLKAQLESWLGRFSQPPMVIFAYHRIERRFFEDRQLLFLDLEDLEKIYTRLRKKIRYEMRKKESSLDLMGADEDKDPGFAYEDIEKKYKEKRDDFVEALRVEQGGSIYSALVVRPRGVANDLDFSKQFIPALMKAVEESEAKRFHPQMEVNYSGGFLASLQEYNGIRRELFRSFGVTAGCLLLLLLLFFRRKRSLWLIPIPLAMGLLWTMGATYLLIGYLNTLTGFVAVLLLGLGIDYGIYLLDRYFEERKKGQSVDAAMELSYRWTGVAIAVGAATTAAAFFALMISDFRGFSQFGFISGVGVFLCLLSICTVMPALLTLSEHHHPIQAAISVIRTHKGGHDFPLSTVWVGVSLVIIAVFALTLRYLPFEYDFTKLSFQEGGLREQHARWDKFKKIAQQNVSPLVYLVDQKEHIPPLKKHITSRWESYYKANPQTEIRIKGAMSILDLVPEKQAEKLIWLKRIKTYLDNQQIEDWTEDKKQLDQIRDFKKMLNASAFTIEDLPMFVQRDLLLYNKNDFRKIDGYLVAVDHSLQISNGWHAMEISKVLQPLKLDATMYHPSGEAIVLARIAGYINRDSLQVIFASLVAVALLVWVSLRSARLMLMSLWPLLLGIFGLVIVQVIFKIPMNLFNIVVVPSLLGIGVDSGVHMLHRYREEPSIGTLGIQREMAGPIFMASLTTVISFASMVFSDHVGLRSMGWTAIIGLVSILFGCLVLLPALMEFLARRLPPQDGESGEQVASGGSFGTSGLSAHLGDGLGRAVVAPSRTTKEIAQADG